MTTQRPIDRARALARELATTLLSLRCRGHVMAVPGTEEPDLDIARRYLVMTLWVPWRVPHVMLVPCVMAGETPAVLVGTWDPRGVALQQVVTSAAAFAAEVASAAAVTVSADDLAAQRAELKWAKDIPDLENEEFWPEVLAKMLTEKRDVDEVPAGSIVATVAERIWPDRLADLRERQRALEE